MNKRQIKKQAYKEHVMYTYDYKAHKSIKRFLKSHKKRKNDRWRTSRKEFYKMIYRGRKEFYKTIYKQWLEQEVNEE